MQNIIVVGGLTPWNTDHLQVSQCYRLSSRCSFTFLALVSLLIKTTDKDWNMQQGCWYCCETDFFFGLSIFQQRAAATNHRTSSDRSSMVSILNHWAAKVSFPPFNLYIFLYWTQHPPNRETKELHTQPTFIVKSCDLTVEYIYSPHTCQIMASRGNWTDSAGYSGAILAMISI